jgi:hypothetical protein
MNRTSPNLKAIDQTADFNVRFYAIIGAATSLAAELEFDLFDLYQEASGLEGRAAAAIFHRYVKFSHKRDTVDRAMRETNATELDWSETLQMLNDVGGKGTARNLVGHNFPQQHIWTTLSNDVVDVFVENYVQQNEHLVLAERRAPQRETYESLRAYCERTIVCADRVRLHGYQLRRAKEQPSAQHAE